jgi:hypothetical protein
MKLLSLLPREIINFQIHYYISIQTHFIFRQLKNKYGSPQVGNIKHHH